MKEKSALYELQQLTHPIPIMSYVHFHHSISGFSLFFPISTACVASSLPVHSFLRRRWSLRAEPPHVVHLLTVSSRHREHQIRPPSRQIYRRIYRRRPRNSRKGKRAAPPGYLLDQRPWSRPPSPPRGLPRSLRLGRGGFGERSRGGLPRRVRSSPATPSTSRSRQRCENGYGGSGRRAMAEESCDGAPLRSLPLLHPLHGLRLEQRRLGGHPRRPSSVGLHGAAALCPTSCSQCGFLLPSSSLTGAACPRANGRWRMRVGMGLL
jgi:hypothetical protein